MVVGDDDVGRAERVERRLGVLKTMGGGDPAAPARQQNAQALEHARLVVDGQNLEPVERLARRDRLGRAGLRAGLRRRPSERRGDEEHRALARARAQADGMLEHPPQTLDDRQAEAEAARHPRALVEPLELGEHRALMLGRDAEAGVPDLDARRARTRGGSRPAPGRSAYI